MPTMSALNDLSPRHRKILQLLEQSGGASVRELSEECGVSEMTIRRDLDAFSRSGLVKRHHGGAVVVSHSTYETPFRQRLQAHRAEKIRVAERVVARIQDGGCIALGNGSTTYQIALLLGSFNRLTVLTPSLRIALALTEFPQIRTLIPGIAVRPDEATMIGPEVIDGINQTFFDLAVLGAAGVHAEIGITEYNADEVAVARAILRRSAQKIVAADASKLGRIAPVVTSELSAIDALVTSREADGELVGRLRDRGLEVEQA